MPRIRIMPENKEIEAASGESVLAAAVRCGIPFTRACGGRARCSTCRMEVVSGLENCEARNELERAMAERLNFVPELRLACQTRVTGGVTVRRLALDARDAEVIEHTASGSAPAPAGVEKKIAILFSDIRGFTTFVEHLPPYDVMHLLNRYFEDMSQIVKKHGGCVDNLIGDGMLALFGVDGAPQATLRAVRAALDMLDAVEAFKPYLQNLYGASFNIGIGVHWGEVVVGTLGAGSSKRTTAIGDAVNFASRIESATKRAHARLLLSAAAYAEVKDDVDVKQTVTMPLPGKSGEYGLTEVSRKP